MTKPVRGFLLDETTLNLLSDIIDGWNYGISELTKKFVDQEKEVRDVFEVCEDLRITRMETSLFQDKIKKSSGQEKDIAVKRLAENKKQIKALQVELLQSKKINKNCETGRSSQKG
jgi:Predicted membrane protein